MSIPIILKKSTQKYSLPGHNSRLKHNLVTWHVVGRLCCVSFTDAYNITFLTCPAVNTYC